MKLFSAIFVFCGILFSQSAVKILEVTGTGTVKTVPDRGVLNAEMNVRAAAVADAVQQLNALTERFSAQLQMIGFKKEEIKTVFFTVDRDVEWENGKKIDRGFVARQNVSVEFEQSKEKIGTIVGSFWQQTDDVRFSFSFVLSEKKKKSVRDELLRRAVDDARERAETLASASGQKLGSIRSIVYGKVPERSPAYKGFAGATNAIRMESAAGFEVKEMELDDEVTIVWELR